MRKLLNIIISVVFIIILLTLGSKVLPDLEIISRANSGNTTSQTLEDGTVIETTTLEDGTIITKEIKSNGQVVTTELLPDGTKIVNGEVVDGPVTSKNACPTFYTIADNEWDIQNNTGAAPGGKPPSNNANNETGCNGSVFEVSQLENGTYTNMQIRTGEGAFFLLIDDKDVVNITVNGTTYILDASNPTLELQIQNGDEVIIDSTNPDGVYYNTEWIPPEQNITTGTEDVYL